MNKKAIPFFLFIAAAFMHPVPASAEADKQFTISGFVKDSATGEALIGASVYPLENPSVGITTNSYGYFSLTLASGKYHLLFQYLGYGRKVLPVDLTDNFTVRIELSEAATALKEVVISGERNNRNVVSNEVMTKLNIKEIQAIPVIFGEKDILKTIQLLPGIKSAGEGNTGFYVRGADRIRT